MKKNIYLAWFFSGNSLNGVIDGHELILKKLAQKFGKLYIINFVHLKLFSDLATKKDKFNSEVNSLEKDRDEYLIEAAKIVIQNQQASVSLLQRKLKIGYSRAGRLIDELEALGIISGYSGSKARSVLVDESYIDKIFN